MSRTALCGGSKHIGQQICSLSFFLASAISTGRLLLSLIFLWLTTPSSHPFKTSCPSALVGPPVSARIMPRGCLGRGSSLSLLRLRLALRRRRHALRVRPLSTSSSTSSPLSIITRRTDRMTNLSGKASLSFKHLSTAFLGRTTANPLVWISRLLVGRRASLLKPRLRSSLQRKRAQLACGSLLRSIVRRCAMIPLGCAQ